MECWFINLQVAIGCVYYNDVKSLERLMDSTNDFDCRIMIDGRFFNHAGEKLSTDGSKELVEKYNNVISLDLYDVTEGQKRNLYLETCRLKEIYWLLILDSDEYVTIQGDWKKSIEEKFDLEHNHYIYDIQSRRHPADYVKYDPRPRLWYEPWEMEYGECHCCYSRKDGKTRLSERPIIDGIQIEHEKSLRTEQHTKDWLEFVQYQLKAESQVTAVM